MSATQTREDLFADGTLTLGEAEKFASISRTKLYDLMNSAELPYTRVGDRRLIPRRALVALLAKNAAGVAGE